MTLAPSSRREDAWCQQNLRTHPPFFAFIRPNSKRNRIVQHPSSRRANIFHAPPRCVLPLCVVRLTASTSDGSHRQESGMESNHTPPVFPDLGRFLALSVVSKPADEGRCGRVPIPSAHKDRRRISFQRCPLGESKSALAYLQP